MRQRDFSIVLIALLAAFASIGGVVDAEETVRVSVPQRGAWDTSITTSTIERSRIP
jgi:hypothetical protein